MKISRNTPLEDHLISIEACPEAVIWAGENRKTAADAWRQCPPVYADWRFWWKTRLSLDDVPEMLLIICQQFRATGVVNNLQDCHQEAALATLCAVKEWARLPEGDRGTFLLEDGPRQAIHTPLPSQNGKQAVRAEAVYAVNSLAKVVAIVSKVTNPNSSSGRDAAANSISSAVRNAIWAVSPTEDTSGQPIACPSWSEIVLSRWPDPPWTEPAASRKVNTA